jgi:UDP:flavonoid glycosyltransferase YjiC (YdhE family)
MGRDQFFNAEQVDALGAGRMLPPDATTEMIAGAVTEVLGDGSFANGAKQMAIAIGAYGGAADAAKVLGAIARRSTTA